MKTWRAVNDWILVERVEDEREAVVGSIAIRLSKDEAKQYRGKVLSVGNTVDFLLNPGDYVIWGKWDGEKKYLNGKEYTAIRDSDVILVEH